MMLARNSQRNWRHIQVNAPARSEYAGRAGAGISDTELERFWRCCSRSRSRSCPGRAAAEGQSFRIAARAIACSLGAARASRAGEISRLADQALMRQVIYQGIREDKPAREIRRPSMAH